jgi:hypothetical protein
MTQAHRALAAIKASMTSQRGEDIRARCVDIWETVIQRAEGYDAQATAEADPSHTNEEAVFADGSKLWWNSELHAWETGPEEPGAAEDTAVLLHGTRPAFPTERDETPPRPTGAIAMLQADHRRVPDLFASYQSARDGTAK